MYQYIWLKTCCMHTYILESFHTGTQYLRVLSMYRYTYRVLLAAYIHVYVAVPRQESMSPVRANAVLSGHCNIFVGYP